MTAITALMVRLNVCLVRKFVQKELSTDFVIMLTCRAKLKHVLFFMNLNI